MSVSTAYVKYEPPARAVILPPARPTVDALRNLVKDAASPSDNVNVAPLSSAGSVTLSPVTVNPAGTRNALTEVPEALPSATVTARLPGAVAPALGKFGPRTCRIRAEAYYPASGRR